MITRYTNGAEQEAEGVYRYSNGAEQLAEGVYRFINGAEQAIWNAIRYLIEKSNTFNNGKLDIENDGYKFSYTKDEDYYDGEHYGDIGGSGTIVFYLDGNWENPEISFDWEGGMCRSNASGTTFYTDNAGDISIYSRKTDGTESTVTVVNRVGIAASGADIDIGHEKGSYSGTLNGSYNRLGLSIHVAGYESATTYYSAVVDMIVENLKLNGTKVAFPQSAEFDYT